MSDSSGTARKQIYTMVSSIVNRDLTEIEHKQLKLMILSYVKEFPFILKILHVYRCKSCGEEKEDLTRTARKHVNRTQHPEEIKRELLPTVEDLEKKI